MSEIKPKLILRTGINISDKSPSPSTKLMLNHGKPNFTINRSKSKIDTQTPQPTTPEASQVVLKSTTFNGLIKPSTLNLSTENEVNKVVLRPTKIPEANDKLQAQDTEPEFMKVLRRTKQPDTNGKPAQDDEPEFIKTQRKIAERLAKENNLDFEHRKSGYFTHVMMSPTSPNKPMELPVIESGKIQKATVMDVSEAVEEVKPAENDQQKVLAAPQPEPAAQSEADVTEVAKTLVEEVVQNVPEGLTNGGQNGGQNCAENDAEKGAKNDAQNGAGNEVENGVQNGAGNEAENGIENGVQNGAENGIENGVENGVQDEVPAETQKPLTNGDNQPKENGTAATASNVNFEPKTVVSFSKELSSEPNKYPDTVKVTQQVDAPTTDSALLQEMSKLKFDISADSEDVTVTPVLRAAE